LVGAKFAVLTVTHETGFAIYQSDVNPYSMKALKFQDGKGDVVRDFVNSCRKYGIMPGIYVGISMVYHILCIHKLKLTL
jgi:alpha-L-fucosidase